MSSRHIFMILTAAIGLLTLSAAMAEKSLEKEKVQFPTGCVKLGHTFDLYNIVFTPSTKQSPQTIYFIHNFSNRPIYLHEANEDEQPYIMHLNGTIDASHWSVLAVAKQSMKFNCAYFDKVKQQHEVVSCNSAIAVCEFPRANFGPNHHGTYWVLFNATRTAAMAMTREHGVWLNPRHSDTE